MNRPLSHDVQTGTRNFRNSTARALCMAVLVFLGLNLSSGEAQAQSWNLTLAQRQAYLNYYAPVILKRGDENNGKQGRDWLTNFDFDRDGNFSNNRLNWINIASTSPPRRAGPARTATGASAPRSIPPSSNT